MNADNPEPIEQRHIDFAQALVALAREHGMRSITVEYHGGSWEQHWTKVHMSWAEGRHGDKGQINLRAEAFRHCEEGPRS